MHHQHQQALHNFPHSQQGIQKISNLNFIAKIKKLTYIRAKSKIDFLVQ